MTEKQLVKLLKSGNFTIAYHDNGECSVYEGLHEYEELEDAEEVGWFTTEDNHGYLPKIVSLLSEALKGKSITL